MAIYELDGVRPQAEGDHWIAENASVMGRVILKRNASIWFNATLRGDNDPITIGENSNVQDGSVLHTDSGQPLTIGKDVTMLLAECLDARASIVYGVVAVAWTTRGSGGNPQIAAADENLRVA